MHTSRVFQPIHALAMLARLIATIAFCFVLWSAVSTADDDVQQYALTGSRLHALRICKAMPPDLGSTPLLPTADTYLQPNRRCFHKVTSEQIPVVLERPSRRTSYRSPPSLSHL